MVPRAEVLIPSVGKWTHRCTCGGRVASRKLAFSGRYYPTSRNGLKETTEQMHKGIWTKMCIIQHCS